MVIATLQVDSLFLHQGPFLLLFLKFMVVWVSPTHAATIYIPHVKILSDWIP